MCSTASPKASQCIRQCLEEGKDEQSILYRWAASKMTPTVTYLGRKFQIDESSPSLDSSSTHSTNNRERTSSSGELSSSFVARMGLSWTSTDSESSTTSTSSEHEELNDYLRDMSSADFTKLKTALRNRGALTSRCAEEMLYSVTKSDLLQEEECVSSKEERPRSFRRQVPLWGEPLDTSSSHSRGEQEDDDEDLEAWKQIVISRCA